MLRNFLILLLAFPLWCTAQWQPDILGNGYQMRYVDQGTDYSGKVRSTVVRKLSPCGGEKAVLYVHGYNDYFFQKEMGDRFVDSCYHFYAVDLRKYGRSIISDKNMFEARNINEYYADIDSALAIMKADGIRDVKLMGHSTGGLITSSYMAEQPDSIVSALILNSPFLDWNKSAFMRKALIPLVSGVGKILPRISISNGNSTAYGESLLADHHGEWTYNTDWKTLYPRKVTSGWIRAIERAQAKLRKGNVINVPVLLMHSDKSVNGDEWTEDFQHGDAVLNVEHISKYGKKLGQDVEEAIIPDGLHDLILSAPQPREKAYNAIFNFLSRKQ